MAPYPNPPSSRILVAFHLSRVASYKRDIASSFSLFPCQLELWTDSSLRDKNLCKLILIITETVRVTIPFESGEKSD